MDPIRVPAIVIAPPGLLRDSLKVVMEASGKIAFVGAGDDWMAGVKMIAELAPKLVIVDTDCLGDTFSWQTLQQFHLEQPQVPFCVVVHTREDEYLARSAGATIVLQAGFSTKIFFDAIAELTGNPTNDQSTPVDNATCFIDTHLSEAENPMHGCADSQGGENIAQVQFDALNERRLSGTVNGGICTWHP